MEKIYESYENIIQDIRNQNLNEHQTHLLDGLLVKLTPFVFILTHLSEYGHRNRQEFRTNRIARNDPRLILFQDDLNNWINQNRDGFDEPIRLFYENVLALIEPILPQE